MTVKVFGIFEGKTRKYSPRVNNMKYSNTFSTIIKRFRFYPGKLGEKYCVFLCTQWGDICVTMCLQLGEYYNQNAKRKPKIRENILSPPVAGQGYTNVPSRCVPRKTLYYSGHLSWETMHKFGRAENPLCQMCDENVQETAKHFLLYCPRRNRERIEVFGLKRDSIYLHDHPESITKFVFIVERPPAAGTRAHIGTHTDT